MKKEIKVRFNLDKPEQRQLWEWLNGERKNDEKSINDFVLEALSEKMNPQENLVEQIGDCVERRFLVLLSSVALSSPSAAEPEPDEADIDLSYFD